LILGFLLIFFVESSAHPVHVSVSNLEFTEKDPVVAIKLFKDDLQLAIYHNYAVEIPLDEIGNDSHNDIILKYLSDKFIIKLNKNKKLRLEYENSEVNDEAIWLYFKAEKLPDLNKVTILNSIFLDIYYDQTNLLIMNYSGKQKGYKFDLKVTEMEISL
jgi:hypothetical protein